MLRDDRTTPGDAGPILALGTAARRSCAWTVRSRIAPRAAGFIAQARERMAARPELYEAPENLLEAMLAAQRADGDVHRRGNHRQCRHDDGRRRGHDRAHAGLDDLVARVSRPDIQARLAARGDARYWATDRFPTDHESDRGAALRRGCDARVDAPKDGRPAARRSSRSRTPTICDTHIPAGTRLLLATRYAGLRDGERRERFRSRALA